MKFNAKQTMEIKGCMLESSEDTTTDYSPMNGLYPNIFLVIILQFKNDNQKQSYLFPIEPSLLSHLHSRLTYVNAH